MKKQFYNHIVSVDTLIVEIDKLGLSEEQKIHLVSLIDSTLYHTILDAILSELSPEDKKVFIQYLAQENHEEVWRFLNQKVEHIETKVKLAADELIEKMHKDIKEAKKK